MRKRKKMSKKTSRKQFSRNAMPHRKNNNLNVMRGGIRL